MEGGLVRDLRPDRRRLVLDVDLTVGELGADRPAGRPMDPDLVVHNVVITPRRRVRRPHPKGVNRWRGSPRFEVLK